MTMTDTTGVSDAVHLSRPATRTMPVEVRLYDHTGVGAYVVLPRRWGVRFLDELNGIGSGEFAIDRDDPVLTANPGLLTWGSVVKFATPDPDGSYREFAAFVVESLNSDLVTATESTQLRTLNVSGRGLKSLLENAIVLPFDGWTENVPATGTAQSAPTTPSGRSRAVGPYALPHIVGVDGAILRTALRPTSKEERFFGWMSANDNWLRTADWHVPIGLKVTDPHRRYPVEWPDRNAYWLWPTPGPRWSAPPRSRALFRGVLTVASDTSVQIHAAADNKMRLFVDEQLVLEITGETDYLQTFAAETLLLSAGSHIIAAEIVNDSGIGHYNPAGLLLTVTDLVRQKVILRSDTLHWIVTKAILPTDPYVPGESAAGILVELLGEAADRGVTGITALKRDFSELVDSRGYPWLDTQERSFQVGTDLLNVADQLTEVVVDLRVSPDMVIHAYRHQGDDWSLGATPVVLQYGRNLLSYSWREGGNKPRTHIVVRDQVGWAEGDSWTARAVYGRIEGYVTVGGSASTQSTAQTLAATLPTLSHPDRLLSATVAAVAGAMPIWDFDVGDTILVTDPAGALTPVEVVSIAGEENEAGTDINWSLELMLSRTIIEAALTFADATTLDLEGNRSTPPPVITLALDSDSALDIDGDVIPDPHGFIALTSISGLTVNGVGTTPTPPASNDMVDDATPITIATIGGTYTSAPIDSTSYTTPETNEPGTGFSYWRSAWWTYTPTTSGTVTIDTQLSTTISSGTDTHLAVYTGTVNHGVSGWTLTNVGYNDDAGGSGTSLITALAVTAGVTYRIQVGAFQPMNYVLRVTGPAT